MAAIIPNSLSYGGIDLPLQSTEMMLYLNARYNLEDTIIFYQPRPWPGTWLTGIAYPWHQHAPRRPRLGELFYPRGASRWAEFHCVISQDIFTLLAPIMYTNPGPAKLPLIMKTDGNTILTTNMYAMPIRVLADNNDKMALYLLSLCDERFFWRDTMVTQNFALTWGETINWTARQMGITITLDVASSAYGFVDTVSDLVSIPENGAILLDALLFNVGLMFIRNYNGTYRGIGSA